MKKGDSVADSDRHVDEGGQREIEMSEAHHLDVTLDNVWPPVLGQSLQNDRDDRMVEPCKELDLGVEHGKHPRGIHAPLDRSDCDETIVPAIESLVDDVKAAFANLLANLIVTDVKRKGGLI